MTGTTVVTREVEWSDLDRESLQALAVYESGICDCGHHASLTSDTANLFRLEERVCLVCKSTAQYARIQQAKDDEASKDSDGKPAAPAKERPSDGRRSYIRMVTPEEAQEIREGGSRGNSA